MNKKEKKEKKEEWRNPLLDSFEAWKMREDSLKWVEENRIRGQTEFLIFYDCEWGEK